VSDKCWVIRKKMLSEYFFHGASTFLLNRWISYSNLNLWIYVFLSVYQMKYLFMKYLCFRYLCMKYLCMKYYVSNTNVWSSYVWNSLFYFLFLFLLCLSQSIQVICTTTLSFIFCFYWLCFSPYINSILFSIRFIFLFYFCLCTICLNVRK
jgi:hypothetical protein